MTQPAIPSTIRVAEALTDAEVADLADILVAAVAGGASVGWVEPPTVAEASAYWRGALDPGVHLLLAEADGRVVGTVQLEPSTRPTSLHRAEVNKLLVHPDHRRRGVARALLEECGRLAADLGRTMLHLDTREGDAANALYRAAGWTEAGRVPFWCLAADGRSLAATVFYYRLLPAPA